MPHQGPHSGEGHAACDGRAIHADDFGDIPAPMREAKRWLVYKLVSAGEPGKKPRKVPFYVSGERRSGLLDSPEDVARLGSFDEAVAALQAGEFDGIGFALGLDGSGLCWQGIDFDDIDQHQGLRFVAEDLPGYVEHSPSGRGLHALGYGRSFKALGSNSTGVEAYAGGRFFTMTGLSAGLGEIQDIADFVERRLGPLHGQAAQRERPEPETPPLSPEDVARLAPELRSALACLDPDDYAVWIAVGHALRGLGDAGRDLWDTWAKGSAKHDPTVTDARWAGFRPDHANYRGVFARAQAAGWINPKARKHPAEVCEAYAPEFSDESLALAFAERHDERLRWVQSWGRWMIYDGAVWRRDEKLLAFGFAREICRKAAGRCGRESTAKALASMRTAAAVEKLARADHRLAASVDQWDADLMALGTPGGVVDLRTGALRPHDPRDYLTKMTAIAPGGDCPLWLRFLARVTADDQSLCRFLQKFIGYSLTGDTSEQVFAFAHGVGLNGKSVAINTVAGVLGDYHVPSASSTWTATSYEQHPAEMAALRGARLVTVAELEQGRRWAEGRIKGATGGERIPTHEMRQDWWNYLPQFKLLFSGNFRPPLHGVGVAMRRRLRLLPFDVVIPASERDPHLLDKLRDEWPGILAWALEGCLAWQREGLGEPASVRTATDAYMEDEDAVAAWLGECCELDHDARTPSSVLFGSWKTWAEKNNAPQGNPKALSQALMAKGFEIKRPKGSVVVGLKLASPQFDFGPDGG